MEVWKSAVETKKAELIGKGWKPEVAAKRALKAARHLHPAHRTATARRIEMADTAQVMTGQFHSM